MEQIGSFEAVRSLEPVLSFEIIESLVWIGSREAVRLFGPIGPLEVTG